ncbi:MAG TPA: hypothetical protein VKE74_02255 [Gemmataceae bacterium]|nr:hypothetical protein [Gemmataceae bacterium]
MPERDPRFVLAVPEPKVAELLAAWLTEKGFPAEPVALPPTTATDPITHAAVPLPGEFQVWVVKIEHAEAAREAIEEQRAGVQALREREAKRANRTGTVTALCEDCGKESDWPATAMGTTQSCPHCHRYMDVPDPDENWDDVDFGSEEPEDGPKEPAEEQES